MLQHTFSKSCICIDSYFLFVKLKHNSFCTREQHPNIMVWYKKSVTLFQNFFVHDFSDFGKQLTKTTPPNPSHKSTIWPNTYALIKQLQLLKKKTVPLVKPVRTQNQPAPRSTPVPSQSHPIQHPNQATYWTRCFQRASAPNWRDVYWTKHSKWLITTWTMWRNGQTLRHTSIFF